MKKFLSRAALGVAAAGVFALASCGNDNNQTTTDEKTTTAPAPTTTTDNKVNEAAEKLLANLIFEQDGTAVSGNVSLPAYLASGETQVTIDWESDNELVKVGTTIDETKGVFTATVDRPEEEAVTVTLTASITFAGGEAKRQFTVLVNPYTISDAIDSFKFAYNNGTVEDDFEVPTSFEFNKQTVTIAWSIPDSAKDYLSVDEDGKTIHVVQQQNREKAQIKAEFTYKGEKLSRNYRLNVYHVRTALELLHTFYDEPGAEAYTLKGYVAHKAGFDASYGNGFLYVVDQTLEGGYYVYRAYCDQETWDQLEIGTPVEIPACKSTDYNGLIEVGQNKENIVKVSTELPALTTEQLELVTKGLAADQLFVKYSQGDKELMYHTGQRVNLTSWKVVEIDATTTAKSGGVFATLEKAGVRVNVQLSKYAATLDGDIAKAAETQVKTLAVGDFVNVTGILSNNNGYCIYVSDATTFTKTTDDANASLGELKNLVDPVFAALAKFPDAITEVFTLDKTTITTADGVELTIEASSLGAWEGNVLTITPETTEKTIKVTVTAAKDGVSFAKEIEIYTKQMTAADKVAAEKEALELDIDDLGEYTLPTAGKTFAEVQISYELVASDIATFDPATSKLIIDSVDADTKVTLNVTFTLGDETDTKVVELTIKNQPRYISDNVAVTAPEEDKVYFLGLNQEKLGQVLYATGAITSNRLATTTAPAQAITVTVEKMESSYAIKLANGKYLSLTSAGKLDLADDAFAWTYDSEHSAWVGTVGTNSYFFGTYSNYNTISASASSYLANEGQWKGALYLATGLTKTKEEKLEYEFERTAAAIASEVKSGATVVLPTSGTVFSDVKATYAKKTEADKATVDGGNITFGMVGTTTRIWFTVTLTCGDKELVEEFYFDVQPVEFKDVTECLTGVNLGDEVFIKGVVTKVYTVSGKDPYAMITDGITEFEVFGAVKEGSIDYSALTVGQVIKASGEYTVYNGIKETSKGTSVIYSADEATDQDKVNATRIELAIADQFANATDVQLATTGTTFTDTTISWAPKSGTGATVDNNKMTVTQGSETTTVTFTATITSGEATATKDVTFKVYPTNTAKAYSTVTSNTTASATGINLTTTLGLDDDIFEVTYAKGDGSDNAAIRTDGVRLYGKSGKANGNSLTFTAETGYKIDWVVIYFDSESDGACAVVKAGDTVLTAADGVYTVNGSAFTLIDDNSNVTKNTQVRFQKIAIHYSVVE